MMDKAKEGQSRRGNEFVDLEQALHYQFEPNKFSYDKRRVMHYALSIGAGADPMDLTELQFVYELNRSGFKVLPTFAAIFPLGAMEQIATVPGLKFNFMNLLHGEQYVELKRPLPPEATVINRAHISQIYDKGSGALVVIDIHSSTEDGEALAFNQAALFIRGIGGFGGERGPSGKMDAPPQREADAVFAEKTSGNQALHYRIASGDPNPLHADPALAQMVGFERPILHGLCTFGFAGRAVLKHFADNDPAAIKSVKARFSRHVYPGERIVTEMWRDSSDRVLFQSKVAERDDVVLANGVAELNMD